ncbi:MAG: HigA family addiction module antitoxin [Candidatus Latescibacterota bacterium]|jgi:addiction module HigA family antidote
MPTRLQPIPPGEILLAEFLEPLGISQNQLARDIDVPVTRVNDIIHARRGITADTALRLAAYLDTTPEFWLNLQSRYDLKLAQRDRWPAIQRKIRKPVSA